MDKGKRPMTEVEAESPRRVTRSRGRPRGTGVHIAEPRESPRRPVIEEIHVEPEQVVREAPAAEQTVAEVRGDERVSPRDQDVRDHERPGPSMMAEPEVDLDVTPRQMSTMMRLISGAM